MKEREKILIVGGNGYVGSNIARSLAPDYHVIATYQRKYTPIPGVEFLRAVSLDDKDHAKALILRHDPKVVIVCTGTNDVNWADYDKNLRQVQISHSAVPMELTPPTDTLKAKFIYISSDYAFAGSDGNYEEDGKTLAVSNLGKSKVSTENFVINRSVNHIILRCAPLIGRGPMDHPSWIDQLRESLFCGRTVSFTKKSYHNPVHISFLTRVIQECLKHDLKNQIFHIGGLSKVSMFECAQILAASLDLDYTKIDSSDQLPQSLINDYSINLNQTLRALKLEPLSLQDSLELMKKT